MQYRDGWWTDSTQVNAVWIDVSGPVHEVIGFDPRAGEILYRSWHMDLRGTGGLPDGRTVPAGLLSGSRERRISRSSAVNLRADPARVLRQEP